jgi:hypothetical protein
VRILTVRNPWAYAIIHMGKCIENRKWSTDYRGPVAIHAGKQLDPSAFAEILDITGFDVPAAGAEPLGAIIGVVDLVDAHDAHDPAECSQWAQEGAKHLVLANPRPVSPIFMPGALGLRELDAEIEVPVLRGGLY